MIAVYLNDTACFQCVLCFYVVFHHVRSTQFFQMPAHIPLNDYLRSNCLIGVLKFANCSQWLKNSRVQYTLTWKRRMSRGLPAFLRQFWLHFMKNLRKNLHTNTKPTYCIHSAVHGNVTQTKILAHRDKTAANVEIYFDCVKIIVDARKTERAWSARAKLENY